MSREDRSSDFGGHLRSPKYEIPHSGNILLKTLRIDTQKEVTEHQTVRRLEWKGF